MSDLTLLFLSLGIEQIHLYEKDQHLVDDFLSQLSPRFDAICQQRPDRSPQDLLLGLMTQQHQHIAAQWQTQQQAHHQMQAVFSHTIGTEHSDKFHAPITDHYLLITELWLLVQGACGIDYSYADEQVEQVLGDLYPDSASHKTMRTLCQQHCMQAFYVGKTATQRSVIATIKCWFKGKLHQQ